jgi:hypothetical protein
MLKCFFEQGKKIPLHFMGAEFFVCRLGHFFGFVAVYAERSRSTASRFVISLGFA